MGTATVQLREARELTGNPRLKAIPVRPNSKFYLGFVTDETSLELHPFEGGAGRYGLTREGDISWYTVTIEQGMVLCTWQEPCGTSHDRLFRVLPDWNMSKVWARLANDKLFWEIMARTDVSSHLLRQTIRDCGLSDAENAICFGRYAIRKKLTLDKLTALVLKGDFDHVRKVLANTPFEQLSNKQLENIIGGAIHYVEAVAAL